MSSFLDGFLPDENSPLYAGTCVRCSRDILTVGSALYCEPSAISLMKDFLYGIEP